MNAADLSAIWTDLTCTRRLLISLVLLSCIGILIPSSTFLFSLQPGNTFKAVPHLWTLITAGFFETSPIMAIVNGVVAGYISALFEKKWGTPSLVKFILVANIGSYFLLFWVALFGYILTTDDRILFVPLCGFSAANSAFAVAMVQHYPDRPIFRLSPSRPLIKHLPCIIVVLSVLLYLVSGIGGKELPLVLCGTFTGWVYLRFFMKDESSGLVGDLREDFALIALLPRIPVLTPLLRLASALAYSAFAALGCCSQAIRSHETLGSNDKQKAAEQRPSRVELDPISERRRALAIKAIDEKLASLSGQGELDIGDDVQLDLDLPDLPSSPNLFSPINAPTPAE